jgi:hypothetical protein
MEDFIMPLVALIGGIASLWIDPKDRKKRWLFVFGLEVGIIRSYVCNTAGAAVLIERMIVGADHLIH